MVNVTEYPVKISEWGTLNCIIDRIEKLIDGVNQNTNRNSKLLETSLTIKLMKFMVQQPQLKPFPSYKYRWMPLTPPPPPPFILHTNIIIMQHSGMQLTQ